MNWSDERLAELLRALPPAPEQLVVQAEMLPEFLPDPMLEVEVDDAAPDPLDDAGLTAPAIDDDAPWSDPPEHPGADDDDAGWLHPG